MDPCVLCRLVCLEIVTGHSLYAQERDLSPVTVCTILSFLGILRVAAPSRHTFGLILAKAFSLALANLHRVDQLWSIRTS